MSTEIAKHEEGHEVLELCGPMLLPCFAIRHLSLNLAYRLIGAGYVRYCWKTNQNCATSVVVSRDHSQNSIININKIRSSRKNLKHVSIEL